MIDWHGKAIGGAKYIDHMGVRGYITAVQLLMVLAVITAVLLAATAMWPRLSRKAIFGSAAAFSIVAVVAWFPAISNGIGLMRALVFPYEMRSEIYLMLCLAAGTLLLSLLPLHRETPLKKHQITD
ncbi:hypothetical protein [Hydrogenophaga sp. NFH-34]|uniref:hypothetical protein n=1 Tax=Hydrogenophaga sp. NFH-34 TaxID=2744446 RepID=UPI001F3B15DC|nr:hypothetical protein [Hydrogenophaga sp. NFH-34]